MNLARALGDLSVVRRILEYFKPPAPAPRVLVVCTGNTCRSPMAAALLRCQYNVPVESAGTSAQDGEPAAKNAIKAVQRYGGDLRTHRALPLASVDLTRFTLVLAMDDRHAAVVSEQAARQRATVCIKVLGIADPFGRPLWAYRHTCDAILAALSTLGIERKAS